MVKNTRRQFCTFRRNHNEDREELMKKAMTRAGLVEQVYEKLDLSKRECAEIVVKFFEIVKETLAKDEDVKISGLGKFRVKQKLARRGRNPQTGVEMEIKGRKVLLFRLSGVLNDKINE